MDLAPECAILISEYLPPDLEGHLSQVGVDHTICVQASPQSLAMNDWYFQLTRGVDFVAGVVAWADLQKPNSLPKVLDHLQKEPKFVGIRHLVEVERDANWILRKDVLGSFGELARRGVPYDMLVREEHLTSVLKVLDKVSDLRVVIDHIAKPDIAGGTSREWQDDLARIAQHPTVYCKLSGMITEASWRTWEICDLEPYVLRTLDMFGYDRVMFGSDWPVCRLAGEYDEVWRALSTILKSATEGEREKVFGANAARFYDLKL